MKQFILIPFISILLFSCGKQVKNEKNQYLEPEDSIDIAIPIDTFALILDALRIKVLPTDYKLIGDLKTDFLIYTDYKKDDLDFYIFKNSNGKEVVFNANDTNFELIIPKIHSKTEKILPSEVHQVQIDDFIPNPKYLNKKFQVVWRTVQLDRKPKNETEYYYQEYDEVIYLKPIIP